MYQFLLRDFLGFHTMSQSTMKLSIIHIDITYPSVKLALVELTFKKIVIACQEKLLKSSKYWRISSPTPWALYLAPPAPPFAFGHNRHDLYMANVIACTMNNFEAHIPAKSNRWRSCHPSPESDTENMWL